VQQQDAAAILASFSLGASPVTGTASKSATSQKGFGQAVKVTQKATGKARASLDQDYDVRAIRKADRPARRQQRMLDGSLYSHPAIYDAINSYKEYEAEVLFSRLA
jgi:hypothetical protein